MNKIEQILHAIAMADALDSKLSPEALGVPGFTSLKIRHLMNNLGAISNSFLEIGSHKGGTLCSGVFRNEHLERVVAIDNFSEFEDGDVKAELLANVDKFKPRNIPFKLITKNCWDTDVELTGLYFDLFMYDGNHSLEDQRKAVTHFLPNMDDEFIFLVDDYCAWPHVKQGTLKGLLDSHCYIALEKELYSGKEGDNFGWHNGLGLFLLRK